MNWLKLSLLSSGILYFSSLPSLFAKTLVIADFNNASNTISIGPGSSVSDIASVSHVYVTSAPVHRNKGYALQVNHTAASDGWLQINFGTTIDVSTNATNPYSALSFWVRGESGGEYFSLDARSQNAGEPDGQYRTRVKDFLPGGITKFWQKVVIPMKTLTKSIARTGLSDINGIILDFSQDIPAPPQETIYVDDIIFHSKTAPVIIDLFETQADTTALRENLARGNDGTAGTSSWGVIVNTEPYSGSKCYQMNYAIGGAPSWGANHLFYFKDQITNDKYVDAGPSTNQLYFAMRKEAGSTAQNLKIELWDDAGLASVLTNTYHTITDAWQTYSIPLSAFAGLNLTKVDRLTFSLPDANASAMVYIDDLKIVDVTTPTVPGSFTRSGLAVANGAIFCSTDVLSVSADDGATDTTLERIRFEHDNLTGGVTWFLIGTDTDTADGTYSTVWSTLDSLLTGTSYQIRAVAEDVTGNEKAMTPYTSITLPLVRSATGFTGTALSINSIQWSWADNASNESGFRIYTSTGGIIAPDQEANIVSWTETALAPNTQYSRYVKPFKDGNFYAPTLTVSKYTLANPASSLGVTARTNSTLTIEWSTGTGGNAQFVIQRAPDVSGVAGSFVVVTTVTGNTFTYKDTGLTTETTYWYKVIGYNGDLVAAAASSSVMAVTSGDPQITHTALNSIGVLGSDVTISALVSSARSLASVTLFYRKKGESSFTSAAFSPSVSGKSYSGSVKIEASFIQSCVAPGGFEYMIVAADDLHTSSSPSSGLYSVTVSQTSSLPSVGANGGTISVSDGDPGDGETALVIPSGALPGSVQVTVKQMDVQTLPKMSNVSPVSAYEFGPNGLIFTKPVAMTLLYFDKNQDGIVDGTNVNERDLKFFWYDGVSWRNLGGTPDTVANTVTASVSHFSTFGLLPAGEPSAGEVRPQERIITPNNDKINDFAQFGITGSFEIEIFNVRGKRVRTLENINIWDGKTDAGEAVESGVYLYQVKSDRLKLSGTIGVAY